MRFSYTIALLSLPATPSFAAFDLGWKTHDDSDLTDYVTRPDIKAPRFHVQNHDSSKITPGYWFLAPYADIKQRKQAPKYYQACSTGPSIYDGNGELVWSGACLVRNQNTCDFRAWNFNDTYYLSGLLTRSPDHEWQGHGFLMDNSYHMTKQIRVPSPVRHMNMHEFNIVEGGRTALHVMSKPILVDATELDLEVDSGWVLDMGFREIDLDTEETLFTWWAKEDEHVNLVESNVMVEHIDQNFPSSWDYFHANAVDKNEDGDYLFSGRFLDTIFKISGKDGSVLWRLGGVNSSFNLDGFNFSRQHDSRFYGYHDGKELITFLDNASDLADNTSSYSSALIVELDHSANPPTASVYKRIVRPDGGLTKSRGNFQTLPNGNSFVCWSGNSYLSEHDADGQVVMEARFLGGRLTTYRAYKGGFVGAPAEDPAIKAFTYGVTSAKSTTVIYVSWNGATEVATWRFHAVKNGKNVVIGEKSRTGFETMFQAEGYYPNVHAEGIAADGSSLGASDSVTVARPDDWKHHSSPQQPIENLDKTSSPVPDQEKLSDKRRLQTLITALSTRPSGFVMLGVLAMSIGIIFCVGRLLLGRKSSSSLKRGLASTLSRSASPLSS